MARPILASSVWPASEVAYLTNAHAASGLGVLAEITNPAELTMVVRPAGPEGTGATPRLSPACEYSGTDQWPEKPMAAMPESRPSQPYCESCSSVGMDWSSSQTERMNSNPAMASGLSISVSPASGSTISPPCDHTTGPQKGSMS